MFLNIIISLIFRYNARLDKKNNEICISTTIFNKSFIFQLIVETAFRIFHPNILFDGILFLSRYKI